MKNDFYVIRYTSMPTQGHHHYHHSACKLKDPVTLELISFVWNDSFELRML